MQSWLLGCAQWVGTLTGGAMRRGFTIVELSFVIVVMAILVAATVPTYQTLVYRARAEEARAMVYAVGHAELRYRRDHGRFLACEAQGAVPQGPVAFPNQAACRSSSSPTAAPRSPR